MMHLLLALISGAGAFLLLRVLIPRLVRAGIVGKDMNKPHQPEVAELGGLGLIGGFSLGLITTVAMKTFLKPEALAGVDALALFAVLATVLSIALIGLVDDLLHIHQGWKAVIPALAALPLVIIEAGQKTMILPFLGAVDFGLFYPLVLVPLGVAGAANACNMLAGFNGLEAGMATIAIGALIVIAYATGATTSLWMLVIAFGALGALLYYNWYPARVFPGDIGTLSIGAIIASACILGNFEMAGAILIIPYALDFLLKAKHRFPSGGWWGNYKDGKLYCPPNGPVGLGQLAMKLFGGIHERHLVLILMGVEAVFGLVAIGLYVRL